MSKLFLFMKTVFVEHKYFFLLNVIITIFSSVLQIATPLFFKYYVDIIENSFSYSSLFKYLSIFILILLLSNFVSVFWHYMTTKLGTKILFKLREDIIVQIDRVLYEDITDVGFEKIKNILFYDTLEIFRSVVNFTVNLSAKLFMLLLIFIIIAYTDMKLFVLLLAAFIIGLAISNYSRKKIKKSSQNLNHEFKETNSFLSKFVDSIKLLKTNNLLKYYVNKHDKVSNSFLKAALKNDKIKVFFKNFLNNINYLFSILVITYLLLNNDTYTTGNVILALFYTNMIFKFTQEIEVLFSNIGSTLPSFEHVNSLLEIKNRNTGKNRWEKLDSLKFDNVSYRYKGNSVNTLSNVNCEFHIGDIVKVTGENGSGKTTFVNILTTLLNPTEGKYLINGKDILEYSPEFLKSKILYISQEELLLDENIIDYLNIITEKNNNTDQILSTLSDINFNTNTLNNNALSDLVLDYNGGNISSGQKKKLLLMKFLLKYENSDIIVIDEIDADLDIISKEKLLDFQQKLFKDNKSKIIFEISHKKDTDIYTRIIKFEKGALSLI